MAWQNVMRSADCLSNALPQNFPEPDRMKLMTVIGLFLGLVQPAWAEAPESRPRLVVDDPVIEGEFRPGEEFRHEFTLWNRGDATLLIEAPKTGCSCVAVASDPVIPPGGQGRVRLSVTVYREWAGRDLKRSVWLMTNDPEAGQVQLVVRGRVAEKAEGDP